MKSILIVDDDLDFLFWLGRALTRIGCVAVPARTISDAFVLLANVSVDVDVLMFNPAFPDAVRLIDVLRRYHPNTKVLAFVTKGSTLEGADASMPKPCLRDHPTKLRWLRTLEAWLSRAAPADCRRADNSRRYSSA
jgi:DNA-binding NtrC family response regulator